LSSANPPSRKDNPLCKRYEDRLKVGEWKATVDILSKYYGREIIEESNIPKGKSTASRYYWLNFHAMSEHGTIENRLPSATLAKWKIKGWCSVTRDLLVYMINAPVEIIRWGKEDLEKDFIRNLSLYSQGFLIKRVEECNKDQVENIERLKSYIEEADYGGVLERV
jgi:hypothetical protein